MEPQTKALSSEDNEPLQNKEQVLLTLDKPDKIFKIVPHKKPKQIITPEEKLERYKRTCINFLNKVNGIITEKPTIEEIKQRSRRNNANFRELHKTAYNAYMNNLLKEKYKNDEVFREKKQELSKLSVHKRSEDKTEYNAYMKEFMRNKYRNDPEHRKNELARKKLRYYKMKEDKLLQDGEIINNP
jgi:hypothetical protein